MVGLRASFTEVGTLDLWFESRDTPIAGACNSNFAAKRNRRSNSIRETTICVEAFFRRFVFRFGYRIRGETDRRVLAAPPMATRWLPRPLSANWKRLGANRDSWSISAIRRFCDVLIEVAAGRKRSPRHEVRWLNLSVSVCGRGLVYRVMMRGSRICERLFE